MAIDNEVKVNGVQMSVHPKFWNMCKDIIDERVGMKKERSGELSQKRLTLALANLIPIIPGAYEAILNAEIKTKK